MASVVAPMGANLTHGGATFRLWAPSALAVSVRGSFNSWTDTPLERGADGYWQTFVGSAREGDRYKFHVLGSGSEGFKRDPYARSLTFDPPWPFSECSITHPSTFPWHDAGYRTPAFHDLVIYQLHVGAFHSTDASGADVRANRPGRFLDVIDRIDYLAALGVTAVQLLPIQEFGTERSLGYNGTDYFSPEMSYGMHPLDPDFERHVERANELLRRRGHQPYAPADLDCQTKQLMALVDLCHVYGLAVIFDVVYNHAGGDFGGTQTTSESIYFLDRQRPGDNNRSLYFTDQGWAGGLVFAFWKQEVRQFLIDNALFFLNEYHADGFRFDEVTVIDHYGGWEFLQHLTDTLRFVRPQAPLIAEYWADQSSVLRPRSQGGAGFDAVLSPELRSAIRSVIAQAAGGAAGSVDWSGVADALQPRHGAAWRAVTHLENHDIVRVNNETDRVPRIPFAAGGNDPRSWYARSRSRVASALLLTAPGLPMLFMGQEFLEEKYWSDNPAYFAESLIAWDGLATDRAMQDHLRFTQELLALRATLPGLRADHINVFHVQSNTRVLAFHRWVEGEGHDVVVVASLQEHTWTDYELGFPWAGEWREVFNSDVFDHWVNPQVAGNGGRIVANGPPRHGFQASARLVVPANSLLVFARA
jgi:1,4-alpha-glucan branching enzyme